MQPKGGLTINLSPELWTAEVVYTGFGTPMLEGGLVVVGEHVAAVGGLKELHQTYPNASLIHKGKALTPPVVNAHTHLDLSRLSYYRGSYTGFIRHVLADGARRGAEAIQIGLHELETVPTGAFGDIVARDEGMELLLEESPLPGVAYREVLGSNPNQAEEIFDAVRPKLLAWKRREGRVKVGISPHTAHTVSAPLLKKLVEFAASEGFPVQLHLAESPEETAYFRENRGPLAEFMALYNPSWKGRGLSPVQYLADLGVLRPNVTLVHGVQVEKSDVQIIAEAGCKVVSCPRSNAGLECGPFPWGLYSKYNVEVALGTDSRGSSPDLDVRNEALFLWGRVDPRVLVRAATRGGYRVLGMGAAQITRGTPVSQVQSW